MNRARPFYMVRIIGGGRWDCWTFQTKRGVRRMIKTLPAGSFEVLYGTGGNLAPVEV